MKLHHRQFSSPKESLQKATRAVDEETGIIRLVYEAPAAPDSPKIFGYGALYSSPNDGYRYENSISGSTALDRDQAIAGAIGEAIERYSATFVPYDELIFQSYSAVFDKAISPWSLSLYEENQYKQENFSYRRLDSDRTIGWVTGYSLTKDVPVLVPAFAVYQPYLSKIGEFPVTQQITTGLACGNTLEEAILSAIYEVVERDAAMLMWLQTRRPPKIIFPESENFEILGKALRAFSGCSQYVTVLDVTTDLCIPSYVAAWEGPIDEQHNGAVFASCANLSPERAVVGALTELAQCLLWTGSLIGSRSILPDPRTENISTIEDHVMWPLKSTNRPAFAFALSSEKNVDLDKRIDASSSDVLDCIQKSVDLIREGGLEVIVVDVTSPDIREIGLHVVRVIIPGAQPLFFGTGLHRLSDRSYQNKYLDRANNIINLHPHPFP